MPDDAPLFDLSDLDFRPSWAKEPSSPGAAPAREPSRQPGPQPGRRDDRRDDRRGPPPRRGKPFGRERSDGPPFKKGPRDDQRGPRREERPERPAPPTNLFPWLRIAFAGTPRAVETVVQQVRHTGKTYSLFDIARILLRNPASYVIELSSAPPPPEGPFYVAAADASIWLSREAAARHLLRAKLGNFYRAETVDVEPPKGNFTVVAVCGMSGVLLGPPNLHDYESRVRELHRQKFGRMDFEQFRSRIKMDRSPEAIEKWRVSASKAVQYFPLEGEAPEQLDGPAALEKHFMAHHAAAQIAAAATCSIPGNPRAAAVDPALAPLLVFARDEEARFPLRLAQSLSRALTAAGLRFHKSANRTTWVSASRPRHLDLAQTAVSDSIRKILETIREKKSIRRTQLLDILAPLPPVPEAPAAADVLANIQDAPPAATEAAPPAPSPAMASEAPSTPAPEPAAEASAVPAPEVAPESPPAPVPEPPQAPPAPKSPEELARHAIVEDILWLTHEGYVVEYADGRLEAVPPPKNPPRPAAEATVEAAPPAPEAEAAPNDPPSGA